MTFGVIGKIIDARVVILQYYIATPKKLYPQIMAVIMSNVNQLYNNFTAGKIIKLSTKRIIFPSTWNECSALFRQVWFVLFVDKRVGVQVKCDPLTTRVIPQCFLGEFLSKRRVWKKTVLMPRSQSSPATLMYVNVTKLTVYIKCWWRPRVRVTRYVRSCGP